MEPLLPSCFLTEIVSENDKQIVFRANVNDRAQLDRWLEDYRTTSGTGWIVSSTVSDPRLFVLNRSYCCQHSSHNKSKSSTDISGRNTGCSAKLKVRIQKDTENTRRKKGGDYIRRGLLCVVTVDKEHNYSLHTADSLRQLRMTTETRDTFSEYF